VVIDHPGGLHEGVADPSGFQLVIDCFTTGELPDILVEDAKLLLNLQETTSIADCGMDLGLVADDPRSSSWYLIISGSLEDHSQEFESDIIYHVLLTHQICVQQNENFLVLRHEGPENVYIWYSNIPLMEAFNPSSDHAHRTVLKLKGITFSNTLMPFTDRTLFYPFPPSNRRLKAVLWDLWPGKAGWRNVRRNQCLWPLLDPGL